MNVRTAATALVAAVILSGCQRSVPEGTGLLYDFDYLGCTGDWNETTYAPEVTPAGTRGKPVFVVRNADTCGYAVGNAPAAEMDGDTLELRYELSSSGGDVAACICEYRARFILSELPVGVTNVTVNGDKARIKGNLLRELDGAKAEKKNE